jgi:hypothetical protein
MSISLAVSNRQLAKIEKATNLLYLVQQEIASTERYAVQRVAESLLEVANEVRAAQQSGQLTEEKLAAVDQLTNGYLAAVSNIADRSNSELISLVSRW